MDLKNKNVKIIIDLIDFKKKEGNYDKKIVVFKYSIKTLVKYK
jgi:hypothetical protein